MKAHHLSILFVLVLTISCTPRKKVLQSVESGNVVQSNAQPTELRLGFYNIENLFDLHDNPYTKDDDFTPNGRNKWTQKRFDDKLDKITKVLNAMGTPQIIGLAEVENKSVLYALKNHPNLNKIDFGIAHYDSEDRRGIDVALLYDKNAMMLKKKRFLRIGFPDSIEPGYTSRDVLIVEGQLLNGETIWILVNHWPSRYGGIEKSEPKRTHVAWHVRKEIDKIQKTDPKAKIILMGDFNDEPTRKSVREVLGATKNKKMAQSIKPNLMNCMTSLQDQGIGSYNYRGNWNMIDQFIVSAPMLKDDKLKYMGAGVFREPWMMFVHDKYGPTPNRTYGGPNYYGGYSDHLPIYLDLKLTY